MGSKAKDVLAELSEIGVMGGKVLPLPFVTPRAPAPDQPDTAELQEKLDHLGKSFSKILEKLDSLEGDVLGLKEAFKSAAEIWTGESSDSESNDPEGEPDDFEPEGDTRLRGAGLRGAEEDSPDGEEDEGGEGESGAGEDGQETSNSD